VFCEACGFEEEHCQCVLIVQTEAEWIEGLKKRGVQIDKRACSKCDRKTHLCCGTTGSAVCRLCCAGHKHLVKQCETQPTMFGV
jgi:hypothetical protein